MQLGHNTTETSQALWNAALTISAPKNRSKKIEKIYFQEFEEASTTVDDLFWRDILHFCARKKFPRGFSYVDTFLHYRANNTCIVLPDDPGAFAQTAICFFQENGRLYSKHDQELRKSQKEEVIISELTKATSDWTIVSRSKNRRAIRIRDYVERKYSHLSPNIRNELYTQINIGFETGFIKKENIIFEDGQLKHVDGLDADENGLILTRAPPNSKRITITPASFPKEKKYCYYDNWCKFLNDYSKYIILSAKPSYTIQTSNYSQSERLTDTAE